MDGIYDFDLILIDGMNLAARSDWIDLSYEGEPVGMFYGFFRQVLDLRRRYSGDIVVLWEGGRSWRKAKYPFYKANRNRRSESDNKKFYGRVDTLRDHLVLAGVHQRWCEGFEADDLAGYYVNLGETDRVLAVSKDQDWWQFLSFPGVRVLYSKSLMDPSMAASELGFPVDKFVLWKIVTGDKSDNVQGIPRFPRKIAREMVEACDRYEEFVPWLVEHGHTSWAEKVRKSEWVLRQNADLLCIDGRGVDPAMIEETPGEYDEVGLSNIFHRYSMDSLVRLLNDSDSG